MLTFISLFLVFSADLTFGQVYPAAGVPYNVQPLRGVADRTYLSTVPDGEKVDLWTSDDGSGRQQWVPTQVGSSTNTFILEPYNGLSGTKRYLSTNGNGEKVDLWHSDDGTGRQRWVFTQIGDDADGNPIYNIEISGGVSGDRSYLSTVFGGEKVDLWVEDDDSGRQQWVFTPTDMDLVSVTFDINDAEILDETPTVLSDRYLCNNTPTSQSQSWSFTRTTTEESTFSYESGFTISASYTQDFGLPGFSGGSVSLSASTTHTWTTSETTSSTTTQTYDFPVNVDPYAGIRAQAIIIEAELDVPYTAIFQSAITGQQVTQTGTWLGVSYGSVVSTFEAVDLATCNSNI